MKKVLKSVVGCFLLCLMAVTMCACALFGDPAFVNESQWLNAFAYNQEVVIEQSLQALSSSKIYKDGYKVKKEDVTYGVTKTTYYNYDGTTYWGYFLTEDVWQKQEIAKEIYNNSTGNISETFKYKLFSYSEKDGRFEASNLTFNGTKYSSLVVMFKNQKLDKIEMLNNGVKNTISYGYKKSFSVVLPEV